MTWQDDADNGFVQILLEDNYNNIMKVSDGDVNKVRLQFK